MEHAAVRTDLPPRAREHVPAIARCSWQAALVTDTDWKAVVRSADGYRTREPVQPAALGHAEATLHVVLPETLRDLYLATDGVVDEPGQWFVIWPTRDQKRRGIRRRRRPTARSGRLRGRRNRESLLRPFRRR